MSPSESELRASLRAGEGERLDTDEVLARARTARRDRRRNLSAIGGAVVAVLAVGGVITGIQLNRTDHTTAGGPSPSPTAQIVASCPASAPIVPKPPGPASGPLFPDDVTSIKVCVYDAERLTTSKDVDGPAARSYAKRFNDLPANSRAQICPQFLTQITIALLPVTPNGVAPTVVGRVGGCGTTSNNTASRNAGQLLGELQVGTSQTPPPIVPSHSVSHGPGPS
jgi:hypothetical protein